ncbi:hypothetical protein BGZ95_005415 [Linnemannia exigua]|uniref:BRCT domain-containing protein n=1 Tax=Linnemannia exigua TaxID=604196 RepID=A0AAD4DGY3_9FUNG|nr:hypothetical protein BGZ95_005415 [Linnemannia exigua]
MAPFDDALEPLKNYARLTLSRNAVTTFATRVGNLVKNPSYDILVACVTKLRNMRLAQDSNEMRDSQTRPSQEKEHDPEVGTFIGSPIWTYDCGPTFPNSDHLSTLSDVEAQTFPSVDAAMTMHRREIDLQTKAEADQEDQPAGTRRRGQGYSLDEDRDNEALASQQTEILGNGNNNAASAALGLPPTISQLQRLLSIRRANSPTPLPRQESEMPPERSPFYEDFRETSNEITSHFSTPRMPTPSFLRSQLYLTERTQETTEQQTSNEPSRKRRMQTEEYTGLSGTPSGDSSGNGATCRNKRPSRANPGHDRFSPDDIVVMHEPQAQSDTSNAPKSRNLRKESAEPGTLNFGGKRVWACSSCLKVMTVGRNIRIYECPACGQNQADTAGRGEAEASLSTTGEDLVDEDVDEDDDGHGQVIGSSQPTLDADLFMTYSHNLPVPPVERSSGRSIQQPQYSSSRSTDSAKIQDRACTEHHSTSIDSSAINSDQSISQEQREKFDDNITRVIEAGLFMEHMPDQVFNESATHIITSIDSSVWKRLGVALCPRVLKYLVAMLSNGWVVRHEWFIDSIKSRMWLPLPNERYLIQGDAQFGPAPGTQHRRELRHQQSLKLFDSCRMFFYGEFGTAAQKSIKKQELLRLVQCGGASVLMKRPPKSSSSYRARSRTLGSIRQTPEPNNTINNHNSSSSHSSLCDDFFSPSRSFLYLTEDTKPWQVLIDKSVPIIICDPAKIPSGFFVSPSTTNPPLSTTTTTTTTTAAAVVAATTTSSSSSSSQSSTISTATTPPTESPTAATVTTTLSQADLKKHGWLRDFQAVSLTWVLNCISCSLMGKGDIDLLYGSPNPEEIRQLDQAWDSWRAKKS